MTPPTCRHRGDELLPGRWHCHSPKLHLRDGLVSAEACLRRCPYVDHPGGPAEPAFPHPAVAVDPSPGWVAVGVFTAPRPIPTLPQTLAELRRAGFTGPVRVFAEPGSPVPDDPGLVVRRNPERLGSWGNWRTAARGLLDETDAPVLLICEDDIRLAPCAALALRHAFDTLPPATWGYASLYTPEHNAGGRRLRPGWQPLPVGPSTWGSLAYACTRANLRALLGSRAPTGREGTDAAVSLAANGLGLRCYFHAPSLVEHIGGDVSSLGHVAMPGMNAVGFSPAYRGYVPAPVPPPDRV